MVGRRARGGNGTLESLLTAPYVRAVDAATVVTATVAGVALALWALTASPPRLRLPGRRALRSLAGWIPLAIALAVAAPTRPVGALSPPPTVRPLAKPGASTVASETVVVRPGDSLWRIAATVLERRSGRRASSAEVARFWPRIYAANREVVGPDPNLIRPGQRLVVPEE